jgi:hypothetical protein
MVKVQRPKDNLNLFLSIINIRCGTGDIAKSKRDIGFFHLSDSCCREHVIIIISNNFFKNNSEMSPL